MVRRRCIRALLSAYFVNVCWRDHDVAQSPVSTTSDSSDYSLCRGDVAAIKDGLCHMEDNNAACDYDGGDCCECTCVDGPEYSCGERGVGFFCRDPYANCVYPTEAPTPSPKNVYDEYPNCKGSLYGIGDDYCDASNNNADCAFDGGDCCSCTCVASLIYSCGEDDDGPTFNYLDPDVECSEEDTLSATPSATPTATPGLSSSPYPDCDGYEFFIGDGLCNFSNNNEACGYDCCECDCTTGNYGACLYFDCVDPDSECVVATPSPVSFSMYPNCTTGSPATIQDGYCEDYNNNEECGYDGGDCCECTCIGSDIYDCYISSRYGYVYSSFGCIDPEADCAPTPSPTTQGLQDCSGLVAHIGDGFCDPSNNNNDDCAYDGGDCCSCTCVPGDVYSCNQDDDDYAVFDCVDPDANCPPTPSAPEITPSPFFTQSPPTTMPISTSSGTSSLSVGSAIGLVSMAGVGLCCVGGIIASLSYAISRKTRDDTPPAQAKPTPAVAPPEPSSAPVHEPTAPGNNVEFDPAEDQVQVPVS